MSQKPHKKIWWVYLLQSTVTGRLYIGISTDVNRRLIEHNTSRKGARATRAGRPWVILYQEKIGDKGPALSREYELKQLRREAKLRLPPSRSEVPCGHPTSSKR